MRVGYVVNIILLADCKLSIFSFCHNSSVKNGIKG